MSTACENKIKDECVPNSANQIFRMEPKQGKNNWFSDLCTTAMAKRNEMRKLHYNMSKLVIRKCL